MNIQNISKEKRNVIVELSADELVTICNLLFSQFSEQKDKENYLQLYSDMMLARDLCQYGHIDDFCLRNIVQCRDKIGNGLRNVCMLSDSDIDTFNSYLEDNDMPTAFGNTDFRHIYKKIVGDHDTEGCEKIKKWMEQQSEY